MQTNPYKREHDALFVPEGFFTEPYTPAVGRVTSPSLGKKIQYCKMILSADANVTYRDYAGNLVSAFPFKAGPQPFLVSEISVVSTGSVLIVHDGVIYVDDSSVRDMTAAFSIT